MSTCIETKCIVIFSLLSTGYTLPNHQIRENDQEKCLLPNNGWPSSNQCYWIGFPSLSVGNYRFSFFVRRATWNIHPAECITLKINGKKVTRLLGDLSSMEGPWEKIIIPFHLKVGGESNGAPPNGNVVEIGGNVPLSIDICPNHCGRLPLKSPCILKITSEFYMTTTCRNLNTVAGDWKECS